MQNYTLKSKRGRHVANTTRVKKEKKCGALYTALVSSSKYRFYFRFFQSRQRTHSTYSSKAKRTQQSKKQRFQEADYISKRNAIS